MKNYVCSENSAIDIGMNRPLWGLTFHVMIYMLTMLSHYNKKYNYNFNLSDAKQLIESSKYMKL